MSYKCDNCDSEFNEKFELDSHVRKMHAKRKLVTDIQSTVKNRKITFNCDICLKEFEQKFILNKHISTVHSENKFKCEQCNKEFGREDSLTKHVKTVHSDKRFKCEQCNKEFGREDNLYQHVEKVHSSKRLICEQCTRTFDTEEQLTKHKNTHEKLSCNICFKEFNQRFNLNKHIKTVHTEKFSCDKCNKTFGKEQKLFQHSKTHDKVRTRMNNRNTASVHIQDDGENIESSFGDTLLLKKWWIRGHTDPLAVLKQYKDKVEHFLSLILRKNPIKYYIGMKVRMFKVDKEGNKEYGEGGFNGGAHTLLRASQFEDTYDRSSDKIWQSFDAWLKNGSGWILERVEYLTINSARYQPIRGSTYIPTPESIKHKNAIINIHNKDNNCFEYAYLSSQHYTDIERDHYRAEKYDPWIGKELKLKGCSIPMELDDIPKCERQNGVAFNVYHMKEDGKLINPIYISENRDLEAIKLLLIEGEETSHYCWIKNFDALLSYDKNPKRFCPYCCYGFDKRYNADYKLTKHMEHCVEYGGQRTKLPNKDSQWIEFQDIAKMLKLPVVIYADFEAINVKLEDKQPEAGSYTEKKTVHECSGFTYTVVSPYFPLRTRTYRGADAGKVFLEEILEEEKNIRKWMKDNEKELNMSEEDEEEFQKATNCHICGDEFTQAQEQDHGSHQKHIEEWLKINRLDTNKIPSLRQVKRQRRIISLELHPDKVGKGKEEECKQFLNENTLLYTYLIDHGLIVHDDNEKIDEEDDYNEEDLAKINKKGGKVRDHDHWNGEFRGAAHNGCNVAYRKVKKIPCFFHNLGGYDSHFIFKNLDKVKCPDPQVIAKSMEKFVGFSIGNFQFKDSMQFLGESLEKLVQNLAAKAKLVSCEFCNYRKRKKDVEKHVKRVHKKEFKPKVENEDVKLEHLFKNLYKRFQKKWKHLPKEAFEMLTRKGVYPYTYMDNFDKFKETKLPPRECFYNDLTKEHISNDDYEFVHKLWNTFGLQTLGDLHNLYMETDTLLLSDVFENFRDFSQEHYGLDPAHFFTAPGLSWSAALKHTKVKLQLPRDSDMYLFFDRGLTGGISMVTYPYARANNPGMKSHYDPKTGQSYILFTDCNNQYGWAMSQYLPTHGFRWVKNIKQKQAAVKHKNSSMEHMEVWKQKILALEDEDDTGYFFEVDLEYPAELHDKHDNFPLAPEHLTIEKDMLSSYQNELADDLGVKTGGKKLCLTLNEKKNHICHYRNLKLYLSMGLKLKKIHRILEFKQSAWLKSYIDLNTKLRQSSDNKFEEGFAKLMNNSFFGKVCIL